MKLGEQCLPVLLCPQWPVAEDDFVAWSQRGWRERDLHGARLQLECLRRFSRDEADFSYFRHFCQKRESAMSGSEWGSEKRKSSSAPPRSRSPFRVLASGRFGRPRRSRRRRRQLRSRRIAGEPCGSRVRTGFSNFRRILMIVHCVSPLEDTYA